ncbi:MAG: DUF47 family protein [Bacilli bacterium]|jgi:hypothetical protein|nr:DUF47 family protein [Bacilli bacterium]
MSKQTQFYFDEFITCVDFAKSAGKFLIEILNHYEFDSIKSSLEKMHKIEHTADLEKHQIIEKLVKEFIPPIEREDIINLAQEIDDVTDAFEDVLMKMYMYNVKEIRKDVIEFAKVALQCAEALYQAVVEFANFHKSTKLLPAIIEVNRLEEVGDRIYLKVVHDLFNEENDAKTLVIWEEIYYRLEKCCDQCEDVADVIETIVMKNK